MKPFKENKAADGPERIQLNRHLHRKEVFAGDQFIARSMRKTVDKFWYRCAVDEFPVDENLNPGNSDWKLGFVFYLQKEVQDIVFCSGFLDRKLESFPSFYPSVYPRRRR